MLDEKRREFAGTERFIVQRRLGGGGFGTVYEVYDKERASFVALKVLRRIEPSTLYRFKREFRNLADVVHPNLVTLYELISEGDQWFLTMELVRGVNFLEFVWGTSAQSDAVDTSAVTVEPDSDEARSSNRDHQAASRVLATNQLARVDAVRSVLQQLTDGIRTLHQHGILHCDIKPSNVLVTDEHRVVLLDFGLTMKLSVPERPDMILGTPRYMSPEQVTGQAMSEASDWYSVGVMIYEALTGVPPFSGTFPELLHQKLEADPAPPSALVPEIPADLDALCCNLLRKEPSRRLADTTISARWIAASPAGAILKQRASDTSYFVGRIDQMRKLKEAFDAMKAGQTVAVEVRGSSGMGKTALVTHFLDTLRIEEPSAVVLPGRCYEQEAMPYKALDSIVDAVSQHLRQLPDAKVTSLLPRGVWALARVFPVLRRVDVIAQAPDPAQDVRDGHELRRRAFAALRELLGRVVEQNPLVLFIDDLQWGDIDSAAALRDLLQPPDPPPLLLIVSYRSEEAMTSPLLRRVLPLKEFAGPATSVREVQVDQLNADEARTLAMTLGDPGGMSSTRAETIARESNGCPLFIDQLIWAGRRVASEGTLDKTLQARVAQLPKQSRLLLEVVAVAGRPLDMRVARRATELGEEDFDPVPALRVGHFVRTRVTEFEGRQEIEPYHDRIRETVVDSLPADVLRRHHARLAVALETSGRADPEALAEHFQAAGDSARAAHYTLNAAEQAAEALAFDRAARLYRLALDLHPADIPDRHVWFAKLADALANAGRFVEAARAFLAARDGVTSAEALHFQRLAAEHLLMGGHHDEGIELLGTVLSAFGMTPPLTPRRALVSLLLKRAYIGLRGVKFHERPEQDIPRDELERVDVCYSVVRGMGFINPIGAIEFQARHLLRALEVGEPYRVARALTFQATSEGSRRRGRRRAEALLQTARQIAERIQNPHAIALCWANSGIVDLTSGRWKRAWESLRRAESLFHQHGATHSYDVVVSHIHGLNALWYAGEFAEYFQRAPEFLSESRNRGDLYAETNLRMHDACRICYQQDDPAGAREEVRRAMARWSRRGMSMEHATELLREAEFFLYEGNADEASRLVSRQWSGSFAPLLLFGIQIWVVAALNIRARIAVARAATLERGRERDRLLAAAERDARRILREGTDWGTPLASLIRAGISSVSGRLDRTIDLLVAAETGFRDVDMSLHASVASSRRGMLMGGSAGRVLAGDAEAWIAGQGIKDPARISWLIAPGQWSGA